MFDRARLTFVTAAILGLLVLSFAWSTALYVMLGFSIEAARPWSVVQYIAFYGLSASTAKVLGISFLFASIIAAIVAGALWLARPKKYYGDARWAYDGEIRKARLLDNAGILIGKRGRRFLRNGESGHVLVAAPTRSGKGVGIVIPNLLSWPGSVVVLDIKHENHEITSGFRAKHQRVFKWSPADDDSRSHCFNPLSTVRSDVAHRISDLQRLATILLPQPAHADPMWQNEARDLFLGLALYVLDDQDQPATIGQIYRLLKSKHDLSEVIQHVLNNASLNLDSSAELSLASFLNKAIKERSGVRSNLTAALNLWANPVIDAATAKSDFDVSELRRRPTSIYVAVKQNQLATLAPLLALFFQQCVDVLGRDLPGEDEPHQVLLMIDEFASLGRLPVIETAMAFLAGYGVRLVNIVQGLSQLDQHYGSAKDSILQNSAIQVYFAPNDETTANYIAKRLGTKTIRTASRSDPGGFRWTTKTSGYAGRNLLLPEEVRQLKNSRQIVFKEGARPAKTGKICYYKDKQFRDRLAPSASVPTLTIVPHPPMPAIAVPRLGDSGLADTIASPDVSHERIAQENALTEVEAMGHSIAAMMADEDDPVAIRARDELLGTLPVTAER